MKNILITGGAGYIGTNIAAKLLQKGYSVFVIDNFSNSKPNHICSLEQQFGNKLKIFEFDMFDTAKLEKVLVSEKIDVVVHLAGKKYVAESFVMQDEYEKQNVLMTKLLLELMTKHNIHKLIFSSSITVYGNPKEIPVAENADYAPLSPYAKNKMDCEKLIFEWSKQKGFVATVLRLSNPIGANTEYMLGDDAKNTKYQGVVPYIVSQIKNGNELTFNGNNHPTKDGTTIRDYICVEDVANAFVLAIENCGNDFCVYNIGHGGQGSSVLEILTTAQKFLDKTAKYSFGPKRDGDISIFVANIKKAKEQIGFCTKFTLDDMVQSHIVFEDKKSE